MVATPRRIDGFRRVRMLRGAGYATTALWLVGWVAFGILVATRAATDLISALAVVICALFGASFALQVAARRSAWQEIRRVAARDDLVASRSRGRSRLRERQRT
jgi:nucleotide-binding universal stress UspA family protein